MLIFTFYLQIDESFKERYQKCGDMHKVTVCMGDKKFSNSWESPFPYKILLSIGFWLEFLIIQSCIQSSSFSTSSWGKINISPDSLFIRTWSLVFSSGGSSIFKVQQLQSVVIFSKFSPCASLSSLALFLESSSSDSLP